MSTSLEMLALSLFSVEAKRVIIELFYLISGALFIMGLRGMSHPETARRGMFYAEFGMLLAIVGTLMQHEIITFTWIIAGMVIGSIARAGHGLMGPDDRHAAADRVLPRLWRRRRRPRRHLRILPPVRPPRFFQIGRARLRSAPRLADDDRQPHRVRQAPGHPPRQAARFQGPEHLQHGAARDHGRDLHLAFHFPRTPRGSFT